MAGSAVWWAGAGFSALAFVIFAILFRLPRKEEMYEVRAGPDGEKSPSLLKGMRNRNFWMISIAFGCYNLVVMAMCSFLPTFLEVKRGYSLTFDKGVLMNASVVIALIMFASIFSAPGGGRISDRLGKRKMMVVIPYILMMSTFLVPFTITGWMIPVYMLVFGIVGGPLAPVLLAAVPEVATKPQLIGIGMSVAALGQNLGMYIGPCVYPNSASTDSGSGRILDDSCLLDRHHCYLEAQGEIEPGNIPTVRYVHATLPNQESRCNSA